MTRVLFAAVLLSGCGGEGGKSASAAAVVFDAGPPTFLESMELDISARLAARYMQPVTRTRCPETVERDAGVEIECIAELDNGSELPVTVTITDAEPGYRAVEKTVIIVSKLESVIRERFKALGKPVHVGCGGGVRASRPGDTVKCLVHRADGHTVSVQATITSWEGRVEIDYREQDAGP